jgi:hypothetical protein
LIADFSWEYPMAWLHISISGGLGAMPQQRPAENPWGRLQGIANLPSFLRGAVVGACAGLVYSIVKSVAQEAFAQGFRQGWNEGFHQGLQDMPSPGGSLGITHVEESHALAVVTQCYLWDRPDPSAW